MQGEFKFAAASIMLQNWIVYMLAADVVQTDGGGYRQVFNIGRTLVGN